MPTAAHVDVLSGFGGMVYDIAVVHVATVLQERIVTATLLAHIVQQKVCRTVINMCIDGETGRDGFSSFQIVSTRFRKVAEVQSIGRFHSPYLAGGLGCLESAHFFSGEGVHQCIVFYIRPFFAHEYGHFNGLRQVAELIDSNPLVRFARQGNES